MEPFFIADRCVDRVLLVFRNVARIQLLSLAVIQTELLFLSPSVS